MLHVFKNLHQSCFLIFADKKVLCRHTFCISCKTEYHHTSPARFRNKSQNKITKSLLFLQRVVSLSPYVYTMHVDGLYCDRHVYDEKHLSQYCHVYDCDWHVAAGDGSPDWGRVAYPPRCDVVEGRNLSYLDNIHEQRVQQQTCMTQKDSI